MKKFNTFIRESITNKLQEYKTCPTCKGAKNIVVDDKIKTCSTCKGEGIVKK